MKQNDLNNTILTQYTLSEKIRLLIDTFNSSIASEANIEEFYNKVFNITTANSYGLDVWGEIVGLSRYIEVKSEYMYFGFNEAVIDDGSIGTFGEATFYSGESEASSFKMGDEMYRSLILIKALANISKSTIADISNVLNLFFKDKGGVIVADHYNMTMSYHFDFFGDSLDFALIKQLIKFVKPTGVFIEGAVYDSAKTFGFDGTGCATFGEGSFYSDVLTVRGKNGI